MERSDEAELISELAVLIRKKFVECVNKLLIQLKDSSSSFKTCLKQSIAPTYRFTLDEVDKFLQLISEERPECQTELEHLAYVHYLFNVKYEAKFTPEMAQRCMEYIHILENQSDISSQKLREDFTSNCVRGLSAVSTFEELDWWIEVAIQFGIAEQGNVIRVASAKLELLTLGYLGGSSFEQKLIILENVRRVRDYYPNFYHLTTCEATLGMSMVSYLKTHFEEPEKFDELVGATNTMLDFKFQDKNICAELVEIQQGLHVKALNREDEASLVHPQFDLSEDKAANMVEYMSAPEYLSSLPKHMVTLGNVSIAVYPCRGPDGQLATAKVFIAPDTATLAACRREINLHNQFPQLLPRILGVTDRSESNAETMILVLDCPCTTLSDILEERHRSQRPFTSDEVWSAAVQLVKGAATLEERGVFHQDLKPHNIVVKDSKYQLMNFNLTRCVNPAVTINSAGSSSLQGTSGYLAPELQAALDTYRVLGGSDKVKYSLNKGDVFSLGLVLLQMTTLQSVEFFNTLAKQKDLERKLDALPETQLKPLLKDMLTYSPRTRPIFKTLVEKHFN